MPSSDEGIDIERHSIIAIPARHLSKESEHDGRSFEASDDDLGLFDLIDEDQYWEADATVDESQEVKPRSVRRMSLTTSSASFNSKYGSTKSGSSIASGRSTRSSRSHKSRSRVSRRSSMGVSNDLDIDSMSYHGGSSTRSQRTTESTDSTGSSSAKMAKPIRRIEFSINENA
jgi:hypothetical protein